MDMNRSHRQKACHRLFLSLLACICSALVGCEAWQVKPELPLAVDQDHAVTQDSLDRNLGEGNRSQFWRTTFLMSDDERQQALLTIEAESNCLGSITLQRAILLTHRRASYRELQKGQQLLQQLEKEQAEQKQHSTDATCYDTSLVPYILALNMSFQQSKSEIVLLRRQANAQARKIKALEQSERELAKKIEAITNIESRMKQRAEKTESQVEAISE